MESTKLKKISQVANNVENKVFAVTLYIGKNVGYRDRIENVLNTLSTPYDSILSGAHPKFKKNSDNESLLKLLEKCGYISVKPFEKNGVEYLRTYTKDKA